MRVLLFWGVVLGWAGLVVAMLAVAELPVLWLVPLLELAAGFEAVYALHGGVERIGRYLQVFYEEAGGEVRWETVIMEFGRQMPRAGSDPLFVAVFVGAVALNWLPILLVGTRVEIVTLGLAHALVAGRMLGARRRAARQRGEDLERFRRIAGLTSPPAAPPPASSPRA